jgi:hypothetical protein
MQDLKSAPHRTRPFRMGLLAYLSGTLPLALDGLLMHAAVSTASRSHVLIHPSARKSSSYLNSSSPGVQY